MSATTHPVAPEEIMALLDGELSAERGQVTSAHVEGCPECRELASSLRGTSVVLSKWSVAPHAERFEFDGMVAEAAQRAAASVSSESGPRFAPLLRRHWILTAASSALAAALLITVVTTTRRATAPTKINRPVDLARTNDRLPEGLTSLEQQQGIAKPEDRFSHSNDFSFDIRSLPTEGRSSFGKVVAGNPTAPGPMIARTVSLSLIASDFGNSRASLDGILARHHGYAANLTSSTEQNSARSLTASLRIPVEELNAAVLELKSLGRVQSESQNGEEVTQQHADLVIRLKNARETEARLQDILINRTGKIADVLAVEQEIARVRGEIEGMEGEQKSMEHRVEFASVELKLAEEYKAHLGAASPSVATRFHNALVAGYRDAVETVVGILLFLAEYGPGLLIWSLILVPVPWLLWRRWRRNVLAASAAL